MRSCLAALVAAVFADGMFELRTTERRQPLAVADESGCVSAFRRRRSALGARVAQYDLASVRAWPTAPFLSQGAGTYDGHDVVAGTQAYMPVLESWLDELGASPPPGYRVAISGNGIEAVRTHTRELGIDFVALRRHRSKVNPTAWSSWSSTRRRSMRRPVPMLGLIGRFKHVPSMLRDPIDAQAKKQTGFSITEATNPDTPIGAAVAALDQLRDFGGRGIVLIDAVKQ